MFPLRERRLIRGCQAHINAGLKCGADYVANYVYLYAPFDGTIQKQYYGNDGGNWLWIKDSAGNSLQFAHLSRYLLAQGNTVSRGQAMAITGNTGVITTGAHLHIQIVTPTGGRLDPEQYNWGTGGSMAWQDEPGFHDMVWKFIDDTYTNLIRGKSLRATEGDAAMWRETAEIKRVGAGAWLVGKIASPESQAFLKAKYGTNTAIVEAVRKAKEALAPY